MRLRRWRAIDRHSRLIHRYIIRLTRNEMYQINKKGLCYRRRKFNTDNILAKIFNACLDVDKNVRIFIATTFCDRIKNTRIREYMNKKDNT